MADSVVSATTNAAAVAVATTVESVVLLTDIFSTVPDAGEGKAIIASINFPNIGTAATAVTVRVRRGNGITGTTVATTVKPVTAATTDTVTILALDNPAPPSSIYSVTAQFTAQTGTTTVAAGGAVVIASDVTPLSP